ncbi:MAG: hypothetical protein ACYSUD_01280 [Planctomycetota bacterium]|jgi:hypothetical protein
MTSSNNWMTIGLTTIISLSVMTSFCSAENTFMEKGRRPLLGVHRWDMYSGKGATQKQELGYLPGKQGFLKNPQWHERAPFFCRLTAHVDWVAHPAEAGPLWFNYPFSQVIYNGPVRKLIPNAYELKNNLDCHVASTIPEAGRMNFVWALYGHGTIHYTRSKVAAMMDEAIEYLTMPNWQKAMDDRPLVIVLRPERFRSDLETARAQERMTGREFVAYIRARVKDAGLKNPYIVGASVPARSYEQADMLKQDGYDAFMDYAGGYGGQVAEWDKGPTYAAATEELINTYQSKFLNSGLPFIPPCTSMQYPWPRALDKQSGIPQDRWYHYQWPKKGDLAARVKAVFDFVATHPKACEAQVVTMYSWNEHSEGGSLCPTMGTPPDYRPVAQWLDEVAAALAAWQYPMQATQEN